MVIWGLGAFPITDFGVLYSGCEADLKLCETGCEYENGERCVWGNTGLSIEEYSLASKEN